MDGDPDELKAALRRTARRSGIALLAINAVAIGVLLLVRPWQNVTENGSGIGWLPIGFVLVAW